LELYGCLMSVRMATTIIKELCFKILWDVLFTDSTTNLLWFNSKSCQELVIFWTHLTLPIGSTFQRYKTPKTTSSAEGCQQRS
jgi:hypothetical protein